MRSASALELSALRQTRSRAPPEKWGDCAPLTRLSTTWVAPLGPKLNNDRPQGQTVRTSAWQGALKEVDSVRECVGALCSETNEITSSA